MIFRDGILQSPADIFRLTKDQLLGRERWAEISAANLIAADTDEEARRLRTSSQIQFFRLRTGNPGKLPAPVDDLDTAVPAQYQSSVDRVLSVSAVGAPGTVRAQIDALVARYKPDELILTGNIWDPAARERSFALGAEVLGLSCA